MIEWNRLYNEDCGLTMSRMADDEANLIFCSPPYNMNLRVRNGKDRVYIANGVCCTLNARDNGRPFFCFDEGIRKASLLERKRLQGFSENFIFPNAREQLAYNQLGNSMTVSVLEAIFKNLFNG